jgi:hypothetical protein
VRKKEETEIERTDQISSDIFSPLLKFLERYTQRSTNFLEESE